MLWLCKVENHIISYDHEASEGMGVTTHLGRGASVFAAPNRSSSSWLAAKTSREGGAALQKAALDA